MIDRFAGFVARRARWVFLTMVCITAIPAYFAYQGLSLNVVLEEMLPKDARNVELFLRFGEQFGGANTTLIEIKNNKGSIYDRGFLEKYKKIAEDFYYNPETHRHLNQSLVLRKTKAIAGGGGRVEVNAILWPDLPKSKKEMAEFRRAVNNQYRGYLVSDDETSAMIIADFKDEANFEKVLAGIDELRSKYEDGSVSINAVGRPVLLAYIYRSLGSVLQITAASVLLIAIILYLYFRTWVGVFVPMFAATVATIWGLGAMGFMRYNLDPLLVLLPAFIFAIVLSHGVQLTTRILDYLEEEDERPNHCRTATERGLASVLVPSTAAIVTDAAGFGVLGLVGIPSIQGLAIICSVWLLAIAPSLIFASSVMCLISAPKSHKTGSVLLNRIWSVIIDMEDHKYAVIGVSIMLLGLGAFYSVNLSIGDAKGSAILWPDSRYNVDNESINTRYSFLGSDLMQVYIEGKKDTMLEPSTYHQIEALDRYMYEHVEDVRPAMSLVPMVKLVNSVLFEGDPSYAILPDSKEEIGFDIYMFRSRGEPGDFAAFTNKEWEIGNVSFFLANHSADTLKKLDASLNDFFTKEKKEVVSDADFLYTGGAVGLIEALNAEIKRSNMNIMIAIAIVITVCIVAYYRTITLGLILLFSLAMANVLTYAFMAWKGVGLNVSTLPLSALGVGLGVDYGIYMADRIKEEFVKAGDGSVTEAIHRAFRSAGNAIFITAVTMTAPLTPWVLMSPLRFQSEMGLLLGLVLGMNMIGALLVVPAAIAVFRPKALFPGLKEKEAMQKQAVMA